MDIKLVLDWPSVGRRQFVGMSLAVAALPAASVVPAEAEAAPGVSDWTIDDQWSGYPRYAEPIGFGRPTRTEPPSVAAVDAAFVEF